MLAGLLGPTYVDPFDRVCLGLRTASSLPATTDLGGADLSLAQRSDASRCVNIPTPPAPWLPTHILNRGVEQGLCQRGVYAVWLEKPGSDVMYHGHQRVITPLELKVPVPHPNELLDTRGSDKAVERGVLVATAQTLTVDLGQFSLETPLGDEISGARRTRRKSLSSVVLF